MELLFIRLRDGKTHADNGEISEKCNVYFEEQGRAITTEIKIFILYITVQGSMLQFWPEAKYKLQN